MTNKKDKITIWKLRNSYLTTIVSIFLVLFLLGLLGMLILNANKLSVYIKENIGYSIILNENAKTLDIRRLQKEFDASNYVKSSNHISKEQAAEELQKELGENFIDFLGYNPLPVSINIQLFAEYSNTDSLRIIEEKLLSYPQVKEVIYKKSLIHEIDKNINKISFIILSFSGLLFLISIALINNTIRLSIYSNRFLIKTMQLVGANGSFIRKPYLFQSAFQGIIGALMAISLLIVIIHFAQDMFEIVSFNDLNVLITLFLSIVVIGIIIAISSTYFAINKYLRIKTEKIYYH
ncbi:MAG: cell division protein FtsX [Bacteroidetes bacterium]|jgi:cell division transport system permease protein|nr:cell division protein FtsX [Bacteroidota bacterium]MBT6685375.1 cell division protein FtsX [Bacteroidota bacterium]MBT7145045.1 cell division protein FtsX [Bacteroidota bacterium]MBT7492730.1 cell division protein FtsX [Bacteroidota bacterium]